MAEHDEQNAEAERLVVDWSNLARVPAIDDPLCGQWEASDGRDKLTAVLWSGQTFRDAWASRLHEVIGETFGADPLAWRYQGGFYADIYRQFFGRATTPTVLNTIAVLPSRAPVRVRAREVKTRLIENPCATEVRRVRDGERAVKLMGMCTRLNLPTDDVVWTPRPNGLRLETVETRFERRYGTRHIAGWKMFQADVHEDADALVDGMIPALKEAWEREGDTERVNKPLIEMRRLDCYGQMDNLTIETDGATARLVSMRWCRQAFDTVILPQPQLAMGIRQVLAKRSKLFLA